MFYIKFTLLFFVFISSTSIGFLIAKKYSDRTKELEAFLELMNLLQNKIRFTRVTLYEAFEELAKVQSNDFTKQISLIFSEKIKKKNSYNSWNETIEEIKTKTNLKSEDIELIKRIGKTLGKTDVEGQLSELKNFCIELQGKIKSAKEEQKKNEKLYRSLGTLTGLIIIIILL